MATRRALRAEAVEEIRLYELDLPASPRSRGRCAPALLVTQPSVSEIERSESPAVPTVRRYVEALGAHLELAAVFDDGRRIPLDV